MRIEKEFQRQKELTKKRERGKLTVLKRESAERKGKRELTRKRKRRKKGEERTDQKEKARKERGREN